MKLGVVGSRQNIPREKVYQILDGIHQTFYIEVIISGGADGVDSFAGEWASQHKIKLLVIDPQWHKFGKSAGARRNQEIVNASDKILILWDGKSRGTKITLNMARKAKKPLQLFVISKDSIN